MNQRQGFLDGEDQKTLISFVLYGDPLTGFEAYNTRSKTTLRFKSRPMVKTICDRQVDPAQPVQIFAGSFERSKSNGRSLFTRIR